MRALCLRHSDIFRFTESEVSSCDEVKFRLQRSEVFRFAESEVSAHAEVKNASHFGRGGTRKRDGEGHASIREGGGTAKP